MDFLFDWFNEKFATPLCHYYTLEGTLAYGLVLTLAVLGIYKLLRKMNIHIDKNFFIALIPFIIYGGWTRALRDHDLGIYTGNAWWWCSPPIYFLIFGVTFATLLVAITIERKFSFRYYKTMLIVGAALLLYNLSLTYISNIFASTVIMSLVGGWSVVFFGFSYFKPKLLSFQNAGIVVSHLFDASSTFTALEFFNTINGSPGYYEQHVLPSFLINIFGPWIMFPLKIVVVYTVLYVLDRFCDDKFQRNFLKIVILILGLALGIRDFLTVSMLVL